MIDGLVFDEATHTYYYNGNKVPGVTSVLEDVGLSDFSMVPPDILAQAQALGTEVHKLIELSIKDMEIPECSDVGMSMLLQYDQFAFDYGLDVIESEKRVFNKKYLYAGTLDVIGRLKKISDEICIVDWKTGDKSKAHRPQTAAYEGGASNDLRRKMPRYTVYLKQDSYEVDGPYKNREDFDVFLHALSVYNYKRI